MKRKILGTILVLSTLCAYFVTFSVTYDSIIPYYYEQYLSIIFMSGVCFILLLPYLLVKLTEIAGRNTNYFKVSVIANTTIALACLQLLSYGYFASTQPPKENELYEISTQNS